MARGINKVILIGNLGRDPETRVHARRHDGDEHPHRDAESGKTSSPANKRNAPSGTTSPCFARLGEIAGEYLRKGSKVYIEGRLQTRKWQDKDGNDRYTTEIIANEMQMLDSRGGGGSAAMRRRCGRAGRAPRNQAARGDKRAAESQGADRIRLEHQRFRRRHRRRHPVLDGRSRAAQLRYRPTISRSGAECQQVCNVRCHAGALDPLQEIVDRQVRRHRR